MNNDGAAQQVAPTAAQEHVAEWVTVSRWSPERSAEAARRTVDQLVADGRDPSEHVHARRLAAALARALASDTGSTESGAIVNGAREALDRIGWSVTGLQGLPPSELLSYAEVSDRAMDALENALQAAGSER